MYKAKQIQKDDDIYINNEKVHVNKGDYLLFPTDKTKEIKIVNQKQLKIHYKIIY